MDESHPIHFKDRGQWRKWLEARHASEPEVWLIHYKAHTRTPCISLAEAVEEALCFGWIDSKVKSVNTEYYIHRYTPRGEKSVWSNLNKGRALRLIKEGKMTPAGLRAIEAAKKSGKWSEAYTSRRGLELPEDLKAALMGNTAAWKNFRAFANSYRNMYIGWVEEAKREGTRKRRMEEVVRRAERNIKPGMMD